MSLLNFSFCVFAAVLVVPVSLTKTNHKAPKHNKKIIDKTQVYTVLANQQGTTSRPGRALMLLALLATSPPAVLYALAALCSLSFPLGILTTALAHHLSHNTLLYPFLTLVYTPLHLGYFFTLLKTSRQ